MNTLKKNNISKFGIEAEFFIVDQNDFPVLGANELINRKCLELDSSLKIEQELSSFQIEINPGPWLLDSEGLRNCIDELTKHYNILEEVASIYSWKLSKSLTPKNISQEIINHVDYFSKKSRYQVNKKYYKNREDILLQNSSVKLRFPGGSIVGCLNEIHLNVQFSSDAKTIQFLNYLNIHGHELIKSFNHIIKINDYSFPSENSIGLIERAYGEWNNDRSIFRVGNLPYYIHTYMEYKSILNTFKKIPISSNKYLDLESTVHFWSRLRGKPENLRVEFRPMEMGENWLERVRYLYRISKEFEKNQINHKKTI